MPEDRSVLDRPAPGPDRVWAYGTGPDQVADVYLPPGPPRVPVVLVHGGFWRPEYDRAHLRPMARALADRGHPTVLVEYARIPGRPDATLADLRRAVAALPDAGIADPAAVVGHSAGGHLALLLAADGHPTLRACLALAPVADLAAAHSLGLDGGAVRDFIGDVPQSRPDLDPAALPSPAIPVAVVHGADDSLVPQQVSTPPPAWDARYVLLPATAHFEVIDPLSDAWTAVIAELDAVSDDRGGE